MNNTIIAPSSAPGRAAIAVIRLSGDKTFDIADSLIKEKEKFRRCPANNIRLYSLIEPVSGYIIDEVTAVKYSNPHSYTGEDMVEIFCHGGPVIVEKIISAALGSGAHYGQKGEFTRRAFLNGKIDVLKAEAINGLIDCRSDAGHRAALQNYLSGNKQKLEEWRKCAEELLMLLESSIEFPEEEDISEQKTKKRIWDILKELEYSVKKEINKRESIKQAEKGLIIPIIGPKNAGKSTLFNILLDSERSIVHHQGGTTRDFISEAILIDGIKVTIIDTAGIGEAREEIEKMGIERAWDIIDNSSIVIWITPGNERFENQERIIEEKISGKEAVIILSKADKGNDSTKTDYFRKKNKSIVSASLIEEKGRDNIKEYIRSAVKKNSEKITEFGLIQNERHEQIAKSILSIIETTKTRDNESEEVLSYHIREIEELIQAFTGKITSDDILNRIFETFCVGK
ncbi:MAG: tRNA uridine-5-carboxymethylaminomethyl(34) synthesis GTPase MnmE [Chitinivibrionales bacterium]|nr:tRNA uridine-5-carboxymethylaminomethyl(34) synthesis GTPase MnmE [Chitinivibrionales bacterium]